MKTLSHSFCTLIASLAVLGLLVSGTSGQEPKKGQDRAAAQEKKKGQDRAAAREKKQGRGRAPEGVEVERDVEYGKVGDVSLKLDIYRPTKSPEQPLPAVVWIHGGGWRMGSKDKHMPATATGLVPHGYVVVSIDYRLRDPFPAAVEDSKCAVRWLRANAKKYGVDPDHIGVMGGSAGGNLALMVGCVDEKAGMEGQGGHQGVSSRVQAVCALYPATDFTAGPVFKGGDAPHILAYLGGTLQEKPAVYKQASPVTHVSKDDPPTLLIHGDHDETSPFEQSESMLRLFKAAGVEATLIPVKNAGHVFRPVEGGKIEPTKDGIDRATFEFFDKHLKKRQAPR